MHGTRAASGPARAATLAGETERARADLALAAERWDRLGMPLFARRARSRANQLG